MSAAECTASENIAWDPVKSQATTCLENNNVLICLLKFEKYSRDYLGTECIETFIDLSYKYYEVLDILMKHFRSR